MKKHQIKLVELQWTEGNTSSLKCPCHKIFRILKLYMSLRGKTDEIMDDQVHQVLLTLNTLDLGSIYAINC